MSGNDKNINIDIKAGVDPAGFDAGVAQTERVSEAMKRAEYAAGQASKGNDALSLSYGNLTNAIQGTAAAFGLYKVFDYARNAALLSARYETLGVSMQVVGHNAGYTATEMEAAARGMQKTGISMIESRQQALRLVQANIDLSQSSKLARIAQDEAVIGNINSSEAFARMIHGIQSGQTDVLRSIGLNISMEQSYAAYASTLGKSANALTQTEKTQAVLNAVMKEGEAIAGTYEAAMGTAGKQLNSMKRYTEDLQLQLGKVFDAPLAAGIGQFTEAIKFASENVGGILAAVKGLTVATGAYIALKSGAAVYEFATALVASRVAALAAAQANYNMAASNMLGGTVQKAAAAAALAQASANMTLTGSLVAATTAMRAFLLTNPIGWITLALGVGATAWFTWGDEAKKAGDKASTAASETMNVFARWERIRKDREAAAKADAAAKAEAYKTQKKTTDDYIASLEKETAAIGKNAYERKYLEAMAKMQTAAKKGQREEIMRGFAAWSLATQAEEENTAAKKANAEAAKESEKAADAAAKAGERRTADLNNSVAADQKALDAMTRKNDLLEKGIVSVEQMALAELQLQYAALDTAAAQGEVGIALQKRIDIAEKMIEQAKRGEHIKAVQGEAEKAAEAWKKTCEDINRSLTDALMRGWENGKGFAANFRDTVKNMFKTLVLQPTISAIMSPVSGAITAGMGALGIPGMANAAGMGGGLLPAAAGLAESAGLGAAGWTTLGTGAGAGQVVGGYGAIGGASSALAAVPVAGWIALAVVAAYAVFHKEWTSSTHTGDTSANFNASGTQTGATSWGGSNANTDAVVTGMNTSYLATAKQLGIGTVGTQFAYGGNTGAEGKNPQFALGGGVAGQAGFYQGETAATPEAIQLAASRAVFTALQGSELPIYLADLFDPKKHNAATMTQADINNTLAFAGALKQVRTGLTETVTPISTAQNALDAIGSTAATFTTDFVKAIDAGMTPEKLANWQTAGQALGQLGDMSINIKAAVPQLTQSTWEMWNTQTTSVRGLISTFDGSVASTSALSAATKERYATEQQLVDQISASMGSLHTMFADSSEQIKLSMMDNQQKQTYYVDQANNYETLMHQATDPAKIEEYAKKLNQAEMNAWGTMDESQKKAMQAPYLANIDAADAYVQEKLGKTLGEITKTSGTDLPALIAQAVTDAMAAAALAQQAVATAMQAAANTMQAAADTPVQLDATVTFHADVPGAAQVAVLP